MHSNSALIGLYWGSRRESIEACADSCLRSLTAMANHGYSSFFIKARSKREAVGNPFEVSLENVRALLLKGVHRRDDNDKPMPKLGFSLSLWSGGADGESYAVSVACGIDSPYVKNNFLVVLPAHGPFSLTISQAQAFRLFEQLVAIWSPDEAVVCEGNELQWEDRRLAPHMKTYLRYASKPY